MKSYKQIRWPSTPHLTVSVCDTIDRYIRTSTLASTIISRKHRGDPIHAKISDMKDVMTLKDLEQLFQQPVTVTDKLDGTNLSISSNGDVYGRSTKVTSCDRYIKTDMGHIHTDIVPKIASMISEFQNSVFVVNELLVFGELMCNRLYNYKELGYVGNWYAFSVVLRFKSASDAHGYAQTCPFSVKCMDEDQCHAVLIMDDVLHIILSRHIPNNIVPTRTFPTLLYAIEHAEADMTNAVSEGLIFRWNNHILKWKSGRFSQPKGSKMLKRLYSSLDIWGPIVSDNIRAVMRCLKSIIEIPFAKSIKSKRYKSPKCIEESVIAQAVESALTKFDIDVQFEDVGRVGATNRVFNLCQDDEDVPWDMCACSSRPTCCVRKSVERIIGVYFGKWKRERSLY
jgi:hypothetical protein